MELEIDVEACLYLSGFLSERLGAEKRLTRKALREIIGRTAGIFQTAFAQNSRG